MTSFFQNVVLVAGDDRTLRFTISDEAGAALSLAGVQAVRWGCVRRRADGRFTPPPAVTKTLGDGITVADAAAGIIEVAVAAADTRDLPGGKYLHQLEMTDATGATTTLAQGEVLLVDDLLT